MPKIEEDPVIEQAMEVLREIRKAYPNDEVGLLAGSMTLTLRPKIFNMVRKGFSEEDQAELFKQAQEIERVPSLFVEAAKKAKPLTRKKSPNYKTPVFKCMEDFEKCKVHSGNPYICRALLAVCVGKHLIPFTK